jgi:predicted dehydrogenase
MPTLKLGLIGCGRIVRLVHLKILTSLPDVELVALAELDPQRREEAKKLAPKAVVFTDYQQLLKMPDVKAVVICLPPALHAEATVAALEHGKHIYVEKPIAISLDEARAVLIAWRRASVVVTMGFNYRFNLLYQAARRHIQSSSLGKLVGARSVFSTALRTLPAWK